MCSTQPIISLFVFGRHISVPGRYTTLDSVNFCQTFRRISEVWRKAQAQNLEKCLIYLSSITPQFLNFFHCMVFDFFFLLRDSENDLS